MESAAGAPRKPRTSTPAFPLATSSSASSSVSGAAEGRLLDQLGQDAARPNATSGPKTVLDDAGEQLRAAAHHRLDDHGPAHPRSGRAHLLLGGEVERDAADLGLVRQPGTAVFTTTGKPSSRAAAAAPSASGARRSGTSGRP